MYHAFNFSKASNMLKIIDHNSIYLLLAGSFTPYCLLALKGTSGWLMYSSIWTLAIGGITHKSITMSKQKKHLNSQHYTTFLWVHCAFFF